MTSMRCLNCQQVVELDESLREKFPEWKVLTSANAHTSPQQVRLPKTACLALPSPAQTQTGTSSADKIGHLTTQVCNLYDIICDSKSPLDKPMCQDCTDKLLDGMDAQLKALEEECAEYQKMLDNLQNERTDTTLFDVNASKIELNKLKTEEKVLRAELGRLEGEERDLERQLTQENRRSAGVAKEERRLWRSFRDLSRRLLDLEADEASALAQLQYTRSQLDKLSKTNVFNLTFHIWHSGRFGTINGFRLGRLPDDQVEWNEINAAWGQTVLLFQSLSKRTDFCAVDYEPVAMGSASYIRCLAVDAKDKDLPLYCTGGYKLLGHSKFDQGMVAFLDCLRQLQLQIQNKGGFSLPHAMQRDKIEDQGKEYSVKMQFNSEERWTKAMKCLLTNLKWALAWVASLPEI